MKSIQILTKAVLVHLALIFLGKAQIHVFSSRLIGKIVGQTVSLVLGNQSKRRTAGYKSSVTISWTNIAK